MKFCHWLRDYFQDIEATIASKNPDFRLTSLAVWEDIISPPVVPKCFQDDLSADVLVAAEKAAESKFHEVKIRLASDCEAMTRFNAEQKRIESKMHVAKVMHEKTQMEAGKKKLG